MTEDTLFLPGLSPVEGKQLQVAFAGGLQSSDGGVLLLREVERKGGLAERLAACIPDWRVPECISHTIADMLRFRMFAIAAGYEDADDCDALRRDPIFKLAAGRGPETGDPLCSQPTMSRLWGVPLKIAREQGRRRAVATIRPQRVSQRPFLAGPLSMPRPTTPGDRT